MTVGTQAVQEPAVRHVQQNTTKVTVVTVDARQASSASSPMARAATRHQTTWLFSPNPLSINEAFQQQCPPSLNKQKNTSREYTSEINSLPVPPLANEPQRRPKSFSTATAAMTCGASKPTQPENQVCHRKKERNILSSGTTRVGRGSAQSLVAATATAEASPAAVSVLPAAAAASTATTLHTMVNKAKGKGDA